MKKKPVQPRLSLAPLRFDEAVTDLLKAKPPPRAKRRKATKEQASDRNKIR